MIRRGSDRRYAVCGVLAGLVWHSRGQPTGQPVISLLQRDRFRWHGRLCCCGSRFRSPPRPHAWRGRHSVDRVRSRFRDVGCVVAIIVTERVLKPLVGRTIFTRVRRSFRLDMSLLRCVAMFAWLVIDRAHASFRVDPRSRRGGLAVISPACTIPPTPSPDCSSAALLCTASSSL